MSSALFGSSSRSTSKHLVEFRAGKMYMQGKTVVPDKRKGLVYLHQADDTLMHFCWKDRFTGSVEEDLIIFPDDCEFKKVNQCTTGRVFALRFKSNNRRIFFWMQEPKADKDEEWCRKINEYLNNPPTPGSQRSTSSSHNNPVLSGSDLSNIQNSDIQNFIGNISQQQLMQILGNGVPTLANLLGPNSGSSGRSSSSSSSSANASSGSTSSTATTIATSTASSSTTATTTSASSTSTTTSGSTGTSTTTAASPAIHLSDLQNILSGMSVPPEASNRVPVDLGSALTAEALQPILTNPEFVEQLGPFLPKTGDQLPPVDELKGTVTSPQFQQAVNLFTSALQSGQLGPLITQFGLGEEAASAATLCDMEGFIKALGKKSKGSAKEEEKKKEKDQDKDDDSMALD